MKAALLITGSPFECQAARSAWHFASALLQGGHTVNCLFLQGDAIFLAATQPQGGPRNLDSNARHLAQLVSDWALPATVCAGSASERALDENCLSPGWRIGGLGDWVSACQDADRILQFTGDA
ncbi:MAG: DsrE/DsrF/TusD sulfur relay family protein [Pseudomonadota bacterium]